MVSSTVGLAGLQSVWELDRPLSRYAKILPCHACHSLRDQAVALEEATGKSRL